MSNRENDLCQLIDDLADIDAQLSWKVPPFFDNKRSVHSLIKGMDKVNATLNNSITSATNILNKYFSESKVVKDNDSITISIEDRNWMLKKLSQIKCNVNMLVAISPLEEDTRFTSGQIEFGRLRMYFSREFVY